MIRTFKHIVAVLIAATALVFSVVTAMAEPASADAPAVTITSVDVTSAPTGDHSTNIVVRGTGFLTAEVTGVYIGTEFEPSHQDVSDTEIDLHTANTLPSGTYPFYLQSAYNGNFYGPDFTYYDTPTITSLSPSMASIAGGDKILVNGANLSFITDVKVGGTDAGSYKVNSNTQFEFNAPAKMEGTYDVSLTYGQENLTTATTVSDQITYTSPTTAPPVVKPVIASITPNRLTNDGGQPIVISGNGFTGATGVVVYGTSATFTVINDTTIDATVPTVWANGAPHGNRAVTVTGPGGTSNIVPIFFTYTVPTITSVTPNHGPAAGGTTVKINGTKLNSVQEVMIGNYVSSWKLVSPTEIDAVTRPTNAGKADVVLTNGDNVRTTLAGGYTYVASAAPTITSLSPPIGSKAGGTRVTIKGSGFTANSTVKFGANAATNVSVTSSTTIVATSPAGTGVVAVTVANGSVTSTSNLATTFFYVSPSVASGPLGNSLQNLLPTLGNVAPGSLSNGLTQQEIQAAQAAVAQALADQGATQADIDAAKDAVAQARADVNALIEAAKKIFGSANITR